MGKEFDIDLSGMKQGIIDAVSETVSDGYAKGAISGAKNGIKKAEKELEETKIKLDTVVAEVKNVVTDKTVDKKINSTIQKSVDKSPVKVKQKAEVKIDPYIAMGKNNNIAYFENQVKKYYEKLEFDANGNPTLGSNNKKFVGYYTRAKADNISFGKKGTEYENMYQTMLQSEIRLKELAEATSAAYTERLNAIKTVNTAQTESANSQKQVEQGKRKEIEKTNADLEEQVRLNDETARSEKNAKKYSVANISSIPNVKANTGFTSKTSNMKEDATSTKEAVKSKKEFTSANKSVQSSVDASKPKLKADAELMESVAKGASEAAEAKKELANASKSSQQNVNNTSGTNSNGKTVSEIDEITNAYKTLTNTEKQYQELNQKRNMGHELTEKESNKLEELTQKREKAKGVLKEQTLLTEKQTQASKEYANELERVNSLMPSSLVNQEKNFLKGMQSTFNTIDTNKKDFQYGVDYEEDLNKLRAQLEELDALAKNLKFADEKDIQYFVELRQAAEGALDSIKQKTNNLQFKTPDVEDVRKKMVEIQKIMNQNTRMPREMSETFEALQQKYQLLIDTKGSVSQFKALNGELEEMKFNLQKSGKIGKSFFTQIGTSLKSMNSRLIAYYFSMYDFIRYARQIFTTIKEYDAALTEMNKVSDESIDTLKQFQKESFALANSVGTVASQIQNSTADFLRLGESFEQAKQSAQDANALFKVSEFSDISDATDALIAMSQAYKELEKSEINDILNYTGNNFSISTAELASALQRSSATLKVAGNDIYEATALVTAGNAVLQDAETVGAGLKMISLRILGTKEAKDELASLGEDVDDFVVQTQSKIDETVRKYTAVASNNFKGVSILDDNGNYKSTYEILRDISQIYQEILDTDKKAGTNRGQALLEVLAGKNRSNVAASILSSPELLTSVYEDTLTKSQGSVAKEMESQLASIESHLNTLKNTWDSLWINDNNREVINFFLDLANGILKAVDKIGVFNSALIGLGAGIGIKKLNAGGGRAKEFALII